MRRRLFIQCIVLAALHAQLARAQAQAPAVRQLGAAEAESPLDVVASIASLRATKTGHVFINDSRRRQIVVLDATLHLARVVTDVGGSPAHYGNGATGMFAYRGDSTLFLSGASLSIAVMDQDGNVGRAMAPPRPSDFGQLLGGSTGVPALDAQQRLVYRAAGPSIQERVRLGKLGSSPIADSAALVRFDFRTRSLDTVTYVRIYTPRIVPDEVQQGKMMMTRMSQILNPMPTVDDWAVLSDGTIVVARGLDYHVDLFDANDHRASGPKVPFGWRRLSDDDKVALIDSSRALAARLAASGANVPNGVAVTPGAEVLGTGRSTVTTSAMSSPSKASNGSNDPPQRYVSAAELPDYQPAFAVGSLRADQDARLWIRTIPPHPLSGGAIYDVLNARGDLIDRVQVPRGSAIAGFGPGGVVYLAERDSTGLRLKRYQYTGTHPNR